MQNFEFKLIRISVVLLLVLMTSALTAQEPADPELKRWLEPQEWVRDTAEPVISLGQSGSFDDQHIFAPCVVREEGRFLLWYCGSQGTVLDRVFGLGLAVGNDGREFAKHARNPVLAFDDIRHSILTPTILSNNNGTLIREQGKLRMWLSSTDFHDKSGLHTLHEATSEDGIHWSQPSDALLLGVYAPTVLKDTERYKMWYTDVSKSPWVIRSAESEDGKQWQVEPTVALKVDQPWEQDRLFYPTVRKIDGVFLMWYGSYWRGQGSQKTALGFAVSRDGRQWVKSPHNPVMKPDSARPWESHYVTSESLMRNDDGSWRMWYASRTKPPFTHKYFAIGTAKWSGLSANGKP
jgi:predicted GH43/DUF377 family glycosyl hydrolase